MNYLGCSGYNYENWKEAFYPPEIPKTKWFAYYASQFNSVEINYSFYHLPLKKTLQKWREQAPSGFIYTLKASRYLTHIKKFKEVKKGLALFYRLAAVLGETLGCILFQFPPNLKYSPEKLKEIICKLNPRYKNVLEFRHLSWFCEEVYQELRRNKIIFCNVSYPNLPETCIKTADEVYIRFHGREELYSSLYSEKEMKEWANRIKKLKAKSVWIYFNNTDSEAYAVKNCRQLKERL